MKFEFVELLSSPLTASSSNDALQLYGDITSHMAFISVWYTASSLTVGVEDSAPTIGEDRDDAQ